jgi:7-cyano-7-deazaguanine reductase
MTDLTKDLTILGNKVDGAITADKLEKFPAPHVGLVTFVTSEVCALCPVTNQPDIYEVEIKYVPDEYCVESKSLKLYLMRFRDTGIFGEAITATIADDFYQSVKPKTVIVTSVQQIRGGLQMTSTAVRGEYKLG